MSYYFYIDKYGNQGGPLAAEELVKAINQDTLVWNDTLVEWTHADNVPEIVQAFNHQNYLSQQSFVNGYNQEVGYDYYINYNQRKTWSNSFNRDVKNTSTNQTSVFNKYLFLILFGMFTCVCTFPFGIYAIAKLLDAKKAYRNGDINTCNHELNRCHRWTSIEVFVWIVCMILGLIMLL